MDLKKKKKTHTQNHHKCATRGLPLKEHKQDSEPPAVVAPHTLRSKCTEVMRRPKAAAAAATSRGEKQLIQLLWREIDCPDDERGEGRASPTARLLKWEEAEGVGGLGERGGALADSRLRGGREVGGGHVLTRIQGLVQRQSIYLFIELSPSLSQRHFYFIFLCPVSCLGVQLRLALLPPQGSSH